MGRILTFLKKLRGNLAKMLKKGGERMFEVGDTIRCGEGREAVVTSTKKGERGIYLRHRHNDNGSEGSCLERECTLLAKKGAVKMLKQKKVWEVTVIDKNTEKVIIDRKLVIDGCNEGDLKLKVGISFADLLKDLIFDNLVFITTEIGAYEVKEKKDKDAD